MQGMAQEFVAIIVVIASSNPIGLVVNARVSRVLILISQSEWLKSTDIYICASCNTKTEQWRPWLYERRKIPAEVVIDEKNISREGNPVERKPIGLQVLSSMTHDADDLSDAEHQLHHWSHDLVLCTSSEAVSPPLSLEERVIVLEERLQELQEQGKTLEGGMSRVGAQLERLEQLLLTALAERR
jgi:hypothetical protein